MKPNLVRPSPELPGLISLRQLADGAAEAPLLDADGQLTEPLVAVDLDVPTDAVLLDEACGAARSCERLLIGLRQGERPGEQWHDLLVGFDTTLMSADTNDAPRPCVPVADPAAEVRALQAAAAASPQASVALAQVLRAGEGLDVPSALNVESFAYSTLLAGAEFRRWLHGRDRQPVLQSSAEPPVITKRTGETIEITLNRPGRRNAYSAEMRDALVTALLVPTLDETVKRVVITGTGPSFCSGGDLDEFGTAPDLATAHFVRTSGGAARLLHKIADRTQARVHGGCVGAGIELPAFAGQLVARPGATFRLPEVGMGLIPGAGGTVSIPRRIGRWRTIYLALSGAQLGASTAAQWGLVDVIADTPTTLPS